jgi:hypothetical protein
METVSLIFCSKWIFRVYRRFYGNQKKIVKDTSARLERMRETYFTFKTSISIDRAVALPSGTEHWD